MNKVHTCDDVEERDQSLENHTLPKINQDEIDNLNIYIAFLKKIDLALKVLKRKYPDPDGFTSKPHPTASRKRQRREDSVNPV